MTLRHRRRSIHAEAIAPWVALSVVLLVWWAGAQALKWARPGHQYPLWAIRSGPAPAIPSVEPIDTVTQDPVMTARQEGPTISPDTQISNADIADLRTRGLVIPVRGLEAHALASSFNDSRGRRQHEAIDILAPRGTDVLAGESGKVAKIFTSAAGGLTVYQFDPSEKFVYYYAHLDGYAPGLKEDAMLTRGEVIGYVGTTGNAPKNTPHLHFAIAKLDPDRRWWGGTALDPFLVWRDPSEN
jgi:murein DD-endopeptidase MepM/ murein hydrolase activator NlpD